MTPEDARTIEDSDAPATVAIGIANQAPTCNDPAASEGNEDTAQNGTLDCTDANGDNLGYFVVGQAAHGTGHPGRVVRRASLQHQGGDDQRRDDGAQRGAALQDAVAHAALAGRQDVLRRPQRAGPVAGLEQAE